MQNSPRWYKATAVAGAILLWSPLVVTVLLSLIGSVMTRRFLFDFLMPAELGVFAFAGAALAIFAAWRAGGPWRRLLLLAAVLLACLIGSQGLAVLLGLADGSYPPAGWRLAAVITVYAGYILAMIVLAVTATRAAVSRPISYTVR